MRCDVSMSETTRMSPAVVRYTVEAGGAAAWGARDLATPTPARRRLGIAWAAHPTTGREPPIGAGQDEQRQDELDPVEAPAKQHPGAEDQPGGDRDQRGERIPERSRPERHHGAQQQHAAGQDVREEPVQLTAAGI